nr:13E12 repeat family protein [Microbacterium halimionae]
MTSRDSRDREIPMRAVAAEVGAALRMSDRTAQTRIDDAIEVTESYPETFASWSAGRISERHVQEILRAGVNLTDAAPRPGTTGTWRRSLRPRHRGDSAGSLQLLPRRRSHERLRNASTT